MTTNIMATVCLPMEMFLMIIVSFINKYNIPQAWKLRGVSRAFRDFLDLEILAKQPIRAFLRKGEDNASIILRNTLGKHLAYRAVNVPKLFGAPAFLPTLLKKRLDWLSFLVPINYSRKVAFAHMLSNQLAFACPDVWRLATREYSFQPMYNIYPDLELCTGKHAVEPIATAAAVGLIMSVQQFATHYGHNVLWQHSRAFGFPLAAAAGGDHVLVVLYLLDEFKKDSRVYLSENYEAAFRTAIDVSLTRQLSAMTLRLLQVYHDYLPAVPDHIPAKWLAKAVFDPSGNIYAAVDTLRTNSQVCRHIHLLELACMSNDVAQVQLFFSSGRLNPQQGYRENKSLQDPLFIAVRIGNVDPVVAILAASAHINRGRNIPPQQHHVWEAVVQNKPEIVAVLIAWGANPMATLKHWLSTDRDFQCSRLEVVHALYDGITAHERY